MTADDTPVYDELVRDHGHDPLTRWATPSLSDSELARFHKQIEEVLAGAWKNRDVYNERYTTFGWAITGVTNDEFARRFEQWATGKHWRWQQP